MTSENTAPEGAETAQAQITFDDLGLSEATLDHFVHALAAALKEAGLCSAVSS